ncbi:hypothetical protein IW262DRAFT_1486498 [Armillaria fumosa]|nr:hypothetical protein IW262DRAFT_1486498 [Armillaria fumosa]
MKQWNLTKLSKYLINVLSKPTEDHTMLGVRKQMHDVGRRGCRVQEDQDKCEDVVEKLSAQFWTLYMSYTTDAGKAVKRQDNAATKQTMKHSVVMDSNRAGNRWGTQDNGTKPMIRRNEKEERTPSRRRSGGWTSSHRKKPNRRKDPVAAPKWRLDVLPSQETRHEQGLRRGAEAATGRPVHGGGVDIVSSTEENFKNG